MISPCINVNVFVIILTYNGRRWIEECLKSVLASGLNGQRVLVVDNASTDGTPEMVRQQFPQVRLRQNDRNLGFAAGNNVGIKLALDEGAEYVMLLNQDTTVATDCFVRLEEAAKESPFGVFAPLQLRYDGSGIDPGMRKGMLIESGEFIDDLWRGQRRKTYPLKEAYGGAVLFHRTVFEAVGLFDECFFLYGEDEDLCRRIRRAGFRFNLVPGALVCHWHTLVQLENQGMEKTNPHARRAVLLLALKDIQRAWVSRCLYVVKELSSKSLHALLRLDFPSLFGCVEDGAWLFLNLRHIKRSRDFDKRVFETVMERQAPQQGNVNSTSRPERSV